MLNCQLTAAWQWLLRIATGAGLNAVIGQDLSDEFLNVVVGSASNDGGDKLDFDADFPIVIDFAFHTTV